MGKQVPKMSARVVNAIRNLREAHGSTSKEIMNYIMSQYSAPESTLQRQMHAALKRGLDYGILKKHNGHYFLNTETDVAQLTPSTEPVEKCSKRKRSSKRKRRKSSQCKRRVRPACGSRSRRRRRKKKGGCGCKAKRVECVRCRCGKRKKNMQALRDEPSQQHGDGEHGCDYEDEDNQDHRYSRSKSREQSLSHSRSSVNSDQDGTIDDQQENHDQD